MDTSVLSCRIDHNRLNNVDPTQDLRSLAQAFEINDDLLQGTYQNGLVIDVGWFDIESVSNVDGPYRLRCFLVRVIRESDWQTPCVQFVARDFFELDAALRACDLWACGLNS